MKLNYLKALESAVVYIEDHLGDEITVEDVARSAGYSYYHLTRQFSALLGESVGSYIKKRRLADGAKKLLYTDKRILDIALDNGFASAEAFSRAFKAAYRVNPHAYRKNRMDLLIASKDVLLPGLLEHRVRNTTVHPRIVEFPAVKTAGLRGQTTLADNVIPALWQQFRAMLEQVPNRLPDGRGFGICEGCQEKSFLTMNRHVLFSEVAAVEVEGFEGLPKPFVAKAIQGGRYAVFTHKGDVSRIMDTYFYIWGTWFLSGRETISEDREDFELYDSRFQGYSHRESEIDIYIPIQ